MTSRSAVDALLERLTEREQLLDRIISGGPKHRLDACVEWLRYRQEHPCRVEIQTQDAEAPSETADDGPTLHTGTAVGS